MTSEKDSPGLFRVFSGKGLFREGSFQGRVFSGKGLFRDGFFQGRVFSRTGSFQGRRSFQGRGLFRDAGLSPNERREKTWSLVDFGLQPTIIRFIMWRDKQARGRCPCSYG
jgi:hypothetical protein